MMITDDHCKWWIYGFKSVNLLNFMFNIYSWLAKIFFFFFCSPLWKMIKKYLFIIVHFDAYEKKKGNMLLSDYYQLYDFIKNYQLYDFISTLSTIWFYQNTTDHMILPECYQSSDLMIRIYPFSHKIFF